MLLKNASEVTCQVVKNAWLNHFIVTLTNLNCRSTTGAAISWWIFLTPAADLCKKKKCRSASHRALCGNQYYLLACSPSFHVASRPSSSSSSRFFFVVFVISMDASNISPVSFLILLALALSLCFIVALHQLSCHAIAITLSLSSLHLILVCTVFYSKENNMIYFMFQVTCDDANCLAGCSHGGKDGRLWAQRPRYYHQEQQKAICCTGHPQLWRHPSPNRKKDLRATCRQPVQFFWVKTTLIVWSLTFPKSFKNIWPRKK